METKDLIASLLALPDKIKRARSLHLDAYTVAVKQRRLHKEAESAAYTGGMVEGKNSETRDAALFLLTMGERMRCEECDRAVKERESAVLDLETELRALTAITTIWASR